MTLAEKCEIREKLYERCPVMSVSRLVVVDNPFARAAFPDDLFNGPFDERWRWRKDDGKITRVFVGDSLEEYEALRGEAEALNPKS